MKCRIEPHDIVNDIWVLQKRVMWIFWQPLEYGPKVEMQKKADELNAGLAIAQLRARRSKPKNPKTTTSSGVSQGCASFPRRAKNPKLKN